MKNLLLLVAASIALGLSAQEILQPLAVAKVSGRIQYDANPGSGAKSMKFVDAPLPAGEVRVGTTSTTGLGLAYLIAFETTPAFRQHLASDGKITLALEVLRTQNGGTPADLKLALLDMGTVKHADHYPHFGAWNNAADFAEIAVIPADPDLGVKEIDVSKTLQLAKRQPGEDKPVIWFAVYVPADELKGVEGRHVIFGGTPLLKTVPGK